MRFIVMLAAAALPSSSVAAPVGQMSIGEFLTKADKLKAKGMGAMFSSDLKPMMAEMKSIGTSYRADVDAARAAGRTNLGCPPPKGDKSRRFKVDDFLNGLRASVPPAQHATTSAKTAFYGMMARRFPC